MRCVPFTCASYILRCEDRNDLLPTQSPQSARREAVVNAFGRKRRVPAASGAARGVSTGASEPLVFPPAPPSPCVSPMSSGHPRRKNAP